MRVLTDSAGLSGVKAPPHGNVRIEYLHCSRYYGICPLFSTVVLRLQNAPFVWTSNGNNAQQHRVVIDLPHEICSL